MGRAPAPAITVLDGPSSDFTALYRQHMAGVYSYFYHQVGNIPDAEDLTALTFTRALASYRRYDPARGSATGWLFGIARNCLRDHRRRPHPSDRLQADVPDRLPLPETQLLSSERVHAIHKSIQQLPPDQRDALALRFFGELRTAEIAHVLGKTDGAVKMLIHRAIVTLRERSTREDWQ